ncbi:MAG TPA: hypothetical protein VMT63_06940 [Bacteroidales bacterium]|nr:hypothetical protein [Bacteroidales bacterium]
MGPGTENNVNMVPYSANQCLSQVSSVVKIASCATKTATNFATNFAKATLVEGSSSVLRKLRLTIHDLTP